MTPRAMDFRHCPRCAETTLHASLTCVICKNSLMPQWQPVEKTARDYATERSDSAQREMVAKRQRRYKARKSWSERSVDLTPREREVVSLLKQGLTQVAIGMRLRISPTTVHTILQSARDRTGTGSMAELGRVVGVSALREMGEGA